MNSEPQTINTFPSISVLIPDGGNYDTLKVLRCLGQIDTIKTHILSRAHWPISRFSRYCKKSHYYASQNDSDWMDTIRKVVQQWNIDVILPATMKGIEFLSQKRKAISKFAAIAPVPEFEMLQIARDKWSFHRFAQEQRLPVIPTIFAAEGNKIIANQSELESVEYPALLKPTMEMGGRGIVKIDNHSDFHHPVKQKDFLKTGHRYIIQNYMPGIDYCLGVFCQGGKILAHTLQKDLLLPEHSFGPQKAMEFVHEDRIIEIGTRLVSAMKWEGMAFIDFRIDQRDNKVKLIEVNPRLGRALMGSLAAGVNFPLILCLGALGISYTDRQHETTRYAHPSAYLYMLRSRLMGRPTAVKLGWRESGWRFSVSDPLPDLIDFLRKAADRLQHNITWKSSSRKAAYDSPMAQKKINSVGSK